MAKSLDELWQEYEETLHPLEIAAQAHDEAYRLSTEAYRRWLAAGGEPTTEKGRGQRDT